MSDWLKQVEQAGAGFAAGWDADREQLVWKGLIRRQKRRRVVRRSAAVAGMLALSLVAWRTLAPSPPTLATAHPVTSPETRRPTTLPEPKMNEGSPAIATLSDGTRVESLTRSTRYEIREASPALVRVELLEGQARFDVVPRPTRRFVVEAAAVTVEVLGTQFLVSRRGEAVDVSVERGLVRVGQGAGSVELKLGEAWSSTAAARSELPTPDSVRPEAERNAPKKSPSRAPTPVRALRGGANVGDAPILPEESAAELLAQADEARAGGRPEAAVAPLEKLLSQHRSDARAPLAAFTLGRVLLDDLQRPLSAAEAFAEALSLQPFGPLAEDAMAREVEAWAKAGRADKAHQRALEWLERYPKGRKQAAVRTFGNLP